MISLLLAACLSLPANATVVDPFRAPACERCAGNRGIEFALATSTVVAGAPGQVVFAGAVGGRNYVVIRHRHDPQVRVTYGGLRSVAVQPNEVVRVGTTLGEIDGLLFVGLRVGETYINPASHISAAHAGGATKHAGATNRAGDATSPPRPPRFRVTLGALPLAQRAACPAPEETR